MKAKPASSSRIDPYPLTPYPPALDRRGFLRQSLALAGGCAVGIQAAAAAQERELLKPVGVGRGIHAGRVAWVHDPEVTDWKGPGDGHWWEGSHVKQERVDDYLHEAALAKNPPSGTFYDPNHAAATKRLPSLGAHEHWNNPQEKKYSRNLGTGEGIELVSVKLGAGACK